MKLISFKRHRFPRAAIRQAIWLYYRFTPCLRDDEMASGSTVSMSTSGVRSTTRRRGARELSARRRDKAAAKKFMKKALKHHGNVEAIVTDGLCSYSAAMLQRRSIHAGRHFE